MSEAIALLNLPAVVLNEAGKISAANHQIETLTDCVRFRAQDRMSLKDSAADTVLRGIIEAFPRLNALFAVFPAAQCERARPARGACRADPSVGAEHFRSLRRRSNSRAHRRAPCAAG